MKLMFINNYIYKIVLSIVTIMVVSDISYASGDMNLVVISGQVINREYGNPVEGHIVYIESKTTKGGLNDYSNILITNNEGYYFDTVYTHEDKGSFIISIEDYYGRTIDTTLYFRFLERTSRILMADFSIFMPYQPEALQARFKYVRKTGDDRLVYTFIDQTKGDNIVEWLWDFGDGTTSTSQNVEHIYPTHGLYKITLTVIVSIENVIKTSVITKQLYISETTYYHMGGHVFSEYFPIDMGYAYLYMIDTYQRYIAIDTVAFDTLGYYYFYEIPSGKYLIKAEPMSESQYYGTLMPTYYGDKLYWEESETINLTNTSWEYNIKLGHVYGLQSGEGGISGNVIYDNQPTTLKSFSAEGVNIYLYDNNDELLTCHYSDNSGDFVFDMIELNSYWIYPEIVGIPTEKIKVELTPEYPIIDNIEIIILSNGVSYIVPNDDYSSIDIVGLPYPNPVSEILTIPLNIAYINSVSYEIYNMYGQMIASEIIDAIDNDNVFEVPVRSIKNGTYILRSKVVGKTYNRYFIVAR